MVALFDSDGTELVRKPGFQHNRRLRNGGAWDTAAVSEIVAQVVKARAATE